ncbi:MAG: hypothetical protein GY774_26360 [Planctomycetes bacterium]|nr:hypothetical protein [Planctomycetota bacterium]
MRRILFVSILVFLINGAASANELSDAMETDLIINTGGDGDWFVQSANFFNDGDAARSGDITHNQESWMQTAVSGVGTLSFYWKVDSEENFDFLEFYLDGELEDSISGLVDLHQMTYDIETAGLHTLEWRYVKDGNIDGDRDRGWVDQLEWTGGIETPAGPLSDALDSNLGFSTDGDAGWFSQTSTAFFDGDAAQSGDIFDDQESLIRTTISGAGIFSFYWKVSSESGYDFLEFYIDGVLQERISGLVDWHQMVYEFVDSGAHTLEWRYVKDYSESAGDDSGWLDLVEWSGGGGTQPPVGGPLSEALDTSLSVTTDGDAVWFSQTVIALFDGDAAQSGTILDSQESLMHTTINGEGTLSFYWKASSEAGYDFLEFYIDGVLQERISGSIDWQQMMYTITGLGSHTLDWRYVKDKSVSSGNDSGWVDQLVWSGEIQPPSGGPLSEAMDTNLSFTTAGESDWFSQTTMSFFDGDAAQSGNVEDSQESLMQTIVSGTGTFSFYWKISSEADYDFLEFYIDGVLQDKISGAQDWHQMVYTITEPGSHNLEWRYVKDFSESAGDDSGWVDRVEWSGGGGTQPPVGGPLSEAMDTSLSFITGGDAEWFSQTVTSFFDGDAAQSGPISHNQSSLLQTTVSGAGTFSFYWKVSSEAGYDFLEFFIDGSLQDRISGSGSEEWQQMIYNITEPGLHTFEWRYVKDWSESVGHDSGWVDQVQWSGGSQPPSGNSLSDALETSSIFITGGDANWFSQDTMFYNDLDAAQSGAISHNQESWMQTTVSGAGNISFFWKVSSENGYDLLEFSIDGFLQNSISGSMDWQQIEHKLSPDSHDLKWRYVKDWSVSEGDDAGWVDALVVD